MNLITTATLITALVGVAQLLLPHIRKSPKMAHSRKEVLDELRSSSKIFSDINITMDKGQFAKDTFEEIVLIVLMVYTPIAILYLFVRITSIIKLLLSSLLGFVLVMVIFKLWKKPKTRIEVQDDKFKEKMSTVPPIYIQLYVRIISNQNITLTGKLSGIGRYLVIENKGNVWPIEWHNILGIGVVKSLR